MRIIQFRSLQNDGTVKVVGTARWVDGKVVVTTLTPELKISLETDPIMGLDHKVKMMEDGIDWLEALPHNYAGNYFFAEAIDTEEDSDFKPSGT
jgi:hypothetical protein